MSYNSSGGIGGGSKMKKRIVLVVVLAVLLAASAYAQTTNFFQLVNTGTVQDVEAAIRNGADVNALDLNGMTPLMWAGSPEVVAALLKAGADINAQDSYYGRTTLMGWIIYTEDPEAINVLLDAGADAKVKDKAGKTALDYAKENWRFKGTEAYRRLQEASE